ncbi:response regulator transcription factor [Hippea maritima]|uniref:Two component transcriptional regulator, winged helix family n=1 Tax=Hippea maritima (strain ATCC 700847 / DSM 10411 / MH2) TaxID=760142 RepID=F2LXH3_HIPMA|nr:response regulator transcription factor [Hippea maritima]AEA33159.1 two component transcriptional regulator, winged helix family [Hippea maritima DSM 10411]
MRILLIEDDKETAHFIIKGLSESNYTVDHADNGKDGLYLAVNSKYDLLIIDRMLPGIDGLSIVKMLRAADKRMPILILSALGSVDEKVEGLRIGADDYLPKPYAFSELLARIEVLLRRNKESQAKFLQVADLKINLENYTVTRAAKKIELKPTEFKLLVYLVRHRGQVITRTMLLENIWGYNFDPQTNIVDVHISRLRSKIDRGFDKELIKTIRGIGYKIEE